ncbi:hypothetical protein [Desulfitobacterium sp. PCE1]|uniref:hypothetical protein n=1 Tax=Desulfitobacterium sp. PCE1 TaxID=146907 RepID=UPI000365327A|nr:hypothetical protein [Desulfitobacterium sp. PCE1]
MFVKKTFFISIFLVLIFPILLLGCSDELAEKKSIAWVAAEQEVKSNLKSPSTAKFQRYSDEYVAETDDENIFMVKGYVDSQNGFGAMIRSDYIVKVEIINLETGRYKIKEIAIK